MRPDVLGQLVRFACVGVTNTLLSGLAYAALVTAGAPFVAAGVLAFCAGAVNGYVLNRRWTFGARDSARGRVRYVLVQAVSLAAVTNLLWLLVSDAGVGRLAAYAVALPVVTLASFAANRGWTFATAGPGRSGPLGDVPTDRGRYLAGRR